MDHFEPLSDAQVERALELVDEGVVGEGAIARSVRVRVLFELRRRGIAAAEPSPLGELPGPGDADLELALEHLVRSVRHGASVHP